MGWKADIASIAAVLALKSTGYIGLAYLALAMQLIYVGCGGRSFDLLQATVQKKGEPQ